MPSMLNVSDPHTAPSYVTAMTATVCADVGLHLMWQREAVVDLEPRPPSQIPSNGVSIKFKRNEKCIFNSRAVSRLRYCDLHPSTFTYDLVSD